MKTLVLLTKNNGNFETSDKKEKKLIFSLNYSLHDKTPLWKICEFSWGIYFLGSKDTSRFHGSQDGEFLGTLSKFHIHIGFICFLLVTESAYIFL